MSKTRVKTKYSTEGPYGSTETQELYCIHNHSNDYTIFYNENGQIQDMVFGEWETNNDLWDAMNRLWYPFKGEWGKSELKDGVEFFVKLPNNKYENNS